MFAALGSPIARTGCAVRTGADDSMYAFGTDGPFCDSVNTMQAIQYLEFGQKVGFKLYDQVLRQRGEGVFPINVDDVSLLRVLAFLVQSTIITIEY